MKIYVPSTAPEDWKRLLAQPERHWKLGHSAMALARCWEEYKSRGWPPEIGRILGTFAEPEDYTKFFQRIKANDYAGWRSTLMQELNA